MKNFMELNYTVKINVEMIYITTNSTFVIKEGKMPVNDLCDFLMHLFLRSFISLYKSVSYLRSYIPNL